MTKRQVRVDDDPGVQARADEWGISFSAAANRLIALGLHAAAGGSPTPAVVRPTPRTAPPRAISPRRGINSAEPAVAVLPRALTFGTGRARKCIHPITRRIGARCGLCGEVV